MIPEYERPYLYPKQKAAIFTQKRITAVEASTKSGKTWGAITWILEGAFLDRPNDHSWWVAPISEQARIAFNRIKQHLTPGSFTVRESPIPTITLINGADVSFRSADNADSLYGEDVRRAVMDEASRSKPDAWHATFSTLTATNGRVLAIGNVKGRRNWFYELCRRIENGQEPNGAFSRITWRDAVAAGVIEQDVVDDAQRNLPENIFKELFEAVASDDAGNPFGLDHIKACIRNLSNAPAVAFGLDLAKQQDYVVLIGLDAECHTCHFSRWNGVPWRETIRRVHETVGEDIPCLTDSTGVGDPVLEELQVGHGNFFGFNFSNVSKQRIMEGLAVGIQSHEISYPDGSIRSELEAFEYERRGGRWFYSAPEGYLDDCVCSLALAREQWATTAPGANIVRYIKDTTARLAREAANVDEKREIVREMMPWRHSAPLDDQDNELTALYEETLRNHPTQRRAQLCARCGEPVTGPTRVSDGVNVWHSACTRFAA